MNLIEQIKLLHKDVFRRVGAFAVTIMLISLAGLTIGLLWPEKYRSSTTVLIEEKKIIEPLLQGTTVPTGIQDRAYLAREVIYSRDVLNQILKHGGWLDENPNPIKQDYLMDQIARRTEVVNVGKDLIKISYADNSPELAFKVTLKYSELFMEKSREAKRQESRQAFQFISGEVDRYGKKLRESEDRLNDFLEANRNVRPGASREVDERIQELQNRSHRIAMELEEARIRQRSLESQLTSEMPTSASITRQSQLRQMIMDLESDLQTLRLSYHEAYPDIVDKKHKIASLREQLEAEIRRMREGGASNSADENAAALNPLYQELRSELSKARTQVAALETRLQETKHWLETEQNRGNAVARTETHAAELTRDYEVIKDIYQDLLRRRESAQIAMAMDEKGDGLSMSIQEPAALPLRPYGLRFIHFAIGAPLLGGLLFIGLRYLVVRYDTKIRSRAVIDLEMGIPVLACIPALDDEFSRLRRQRQWTIAAIAFAIIITSYGSVGILKIIDII